MPLASLWIRFVRWARTGRFSAAVWPVVYMAHLLVAVWVATAFTHFVMGRPKDFALIRLLTMGALSGSAAYGLGAQFLHPRSVVEPWLLGPLAMFSGFATVGALLPKNPDPLFAIDPQFVLFVVIMGLALGFTIWLYRRCTATPNNRWRGP